MRSDLLNHACYGAAPSGRRVSVSFVLAALAVGSTIVSTSSIARAQTLRPDAVVGKPGLPIILPTPVEPPVITGDLASIAEKMHCSVASVQVLELILADINTRTPTQKKISNRFIWAARMQQGQPQVAGAPDRPINVTVLPGGLVQVRISVTAVTPALTSAIKSIGGTVISTFAGSKKINALLPLLKIETLASRSDITYIDTPPLLHHGGKPGASLNASRSTRQRALVPYRSTTEPAAFSKASAAARNAIAGASLPLQGLSGMSSVLSNALQQTTYFEGDTTHQANTARANYGISGKGIKIGVLSDDVDYLPDMRSQGYLPTVTVVPGQSGDDTGNSGTGEGTAMLTIVHALAPDASLYFATANGGPDNFANNIATLRDTYGCDIIIDDAGYFDESPFSDGTIAQAVDHVTGEGALYFSSAGNDGNYSTRTHLYFGTGGRASKEITNTSSNCWEGDFTPVDTGMSIGLNPVTLNGFVDTSGNTTEYDVTGDGNPNHLPEYQQFDPIGGYFFLYWADAYNSVSDQYYALTIASDGTLIDLEGAGNEPYAQAVFEEFGDSLYILNFQGSQTALHASVMPFYSLPAAAPGMAVVTPYQTSGHSSAANAFSVAAIGAIPANASDEDDNGPYPNPFTAANMVNYFSSDGPRRIFYTADSLGDPLPVTSGKVTFASGGYVTREKPDIAAADGVDTPTPGFAPFYGTSAAAPHAGAIAGLVLSYGTTKAPIAFSPETTIIGRNLSVSEMRTVLKGSAIKSVDSDANSAYTVNGATGVDSGAGIVMPINAIQYLQNFLSPASIATKVVNGSTIGVSWTTDLPASSVVHYGKTPTTMTLIARGSGTPSTTHTVSVPNIASGSTYYFTVESVTPTGSVSYVGTSADAQLLTSAPAPVQKSNVVLSNLALIRTSAGLIQATVTLTNTGQGDASAITFTATLGGNAATPASSALGALKAGKSVKTVLLFPAMPTGTQAPFVLTGSDGTNAISANVLVQIP